jgi:Peptidase family M28
MSDQIAPQANTPTSALLSVLIVAVAVGAAFYCLVPPAVVPDTAPATEFSASRAFEYLKVIAREPHPTGSAANAHVRDYLIQQLQGLGLDPQVQRTGITSLLDIYPGPYAAGIVENVMARLRGTSSTGAVLLMAHYDSVSTAPGATDDGSGVVTLLETLRALKNGPPLRNDVIFLFTDGEELGEVGSQGFVSEHPWAKDISAVWNMDSGGSCGAADIDISNGWALQEFKKVVPHPLTSSIGAELAKLGPPGGDDTLVFDRKKLTIADVSYGGCQFRYHTAKDDVENIDLRSVQHLGIYTLAVARDWGSANLGETPAPLDSLFFVIPGRIVSYPAALVRPLTAFLVILFVIVLVLGLRRRQLRLRAALALASLLWLGSTLLCASVAALLWWALKRLGLVNFSYSSAYNARTYALAFVALTIAEGLAVFGFSRRRIDAENLAIAGLFWYLILAALSGWLTPGLNVLFAFPLGLGLLSLVVSFRSGGDRMLSTILRLLFAVPAIFLFTLLIAAIDMGLPGDPLPSLVISVILTAILLMFLAPQLDPITGAGNLCVSAAFALAGVVLLAWGAFHSGYDNGHPRPDTIAYWRDADTGKSSWISLDEKPDTWTSQFLRGRVEKATQNIFVSPGDRILKSEAPPLPLPAPQITLLDDSSAANERVLRFRLASERQPSTLWVSVQNATILRATIDGKNAPSKMVDPRDKLWGFYYAAPPARGIELMIAVNPSDRPQITLTDQTNGLPEIRGFHTKPRTPDLMPLNYFPAFDSTALVTTTLTAP